MDALFVPNPFLQEMSVGVKETKVMRSTLSNLLFVLHVFVMELRSGWKRLQLLVTPEKLGRKSEESDPTYNSEEEGSAQISPKAFADNEVSTSSGQLKGEINSKKRYDACCIEQQVQNDTMEGGCKKVVERGRGRNWRSKSRW